MSINVFLNSILDQALDRFHLSRKDLPRLLLIAAVSPVVYFLISKYGDLVPAIMLTIGGIVITLLFLATWMLAGYFTTKTLFWIGADLSLTFFLAQAYCDSGNRNPTADAALKSLLLVIFTYLVIHFSILLYRSFNDGVAMLKVEKTDTVKDIWLPTTFFAISLGLFVWQLSLIIVPTALGLCDGELFLK